MEQDDDNNKNNSKNKNKIGDDEIFISNSEGETFFDFSPKKSIAERRGFNNNVAKINTRISHFGATTPLVSPAVQSARLTIPPGISPTALLESPIMLPNSLVMPSPTTGSFAMLPPLTDERSMLTSITHEQRKLDVPSTSNIAASFKFKPQANLDPNSLSPCYDSLNQDNQMVFEDEQMLDFSFSEDFSNDYSARNSGVHIEVPMISCSEETSDESTLAENCINDDDKEMSDANATGAKISEDGYNWRKYGQKQVKGSEYPRSYYKCTQNNCEVKKKVERSHDGHITEIIYRGNHNHAKPHSSRRGGSIPLNDHEISEIVETTETCDDRVDADSIWGNNQSHLDSRKRFRSLGMSESNNALDHSEDGATQAVLPLPGDVEEAEESESKRRRNESYPVETMVVPSRAIREPRVVVQVESEVDILDDGYRWRKYGQKVVKGNPNPRSYYKCTTAGCTVRKHVERASHNLKFIITTYEGKHNHDVPTARNNIHISANDSSRANVHASGIPKSETHQTLRPHFDRKPPDFTNEFLRSSLMGSFGNDMKYSTLNSIMPFGAARAYGTNPDHAVGPQARPIGSIFPEFPMPLPMNLPSSGINFNYAQPMNSIHSYLSGQLVMDINDAGFLRPKQELKDESLYVACAPSLDQASSSLAPPSTSPSQSIYQSAMQNFSS